MTLGELLEGLKNGTVNMCGCLGAINGQPHCPCQMARLAKEKEKQVLVDAVGSETCKINLPTSKL